MLTERPILFSSEMVRAILDGRKTVTRRICKFNAAGRLKLAGSPKNWHPYDPDAVKACPYGQPGDRLWVRHSHFDLKPPPTNPANYQIWDEFTRTVRWKSGELVKDVTPRMDEGNGWKNHPSIHMPRWASRITLEVTGVRVERLQEITDAGAIQEGVGPFANSFTIDCDTKSPRDEFGRLWDSINAKRGFGWDKNPLVWVIEFKRV